MPRHLIETGRGRPLLDVASYARRGPGERVRLSPDEMALIQRTVSRTPEVMVKVLTRGGQSLRAVRAHLAYLNRRGELDIETDDGERLTGNGIESQLIGDWDLDVEQYRRRADLRPRKDGAPPKLVRKILFSMPPGTSPGKVLEAVRNFAREEFGTQHRYTMVLHTDEPHPHVHMVVKAMSERGERLNIHKETLRRWRREFASHLRRLGVAANATDRAVRGAYGPRWRDAIYRADLRGESDFLRAREAILTRGPQTGSQERERAKRRLIETRRNIEAGWNAAAESMRCIGMVDTADQISGALNRSTQRIR
jgi:relaxase-like protein